MNKSINVWGGISILAGIMIGSGIFFLGGQILERVGNSLPLSILAWIVGGIITLFSGLTYAELGTLFPENGGYFVYLKEAYGKKVAFLAGHMNLVLSSSGSIALLATLFAQVVSNIFPTVADDLASLSIAVIILLTVLNYSGIKNGLLTQIVFLAAKLIPIIMIIVMGFIIGNQPLMGNPTVESASFFDALVGFGFAVVGTLFAYEGWTNLNSVAGQMKEKKDLPKAIIAAIGGVMVVYVLFIIALYRLVAFSALFEAPNGWFIFFAAYELFGDAGQLVIMISVAISVFGALNGSILVFPRVYQKMAKDGLFFSIFAKESEVYKTPSYALVISAFVSIVLIVLGFDINALLTFVVFAGFVFNTLIFISVFIFRKRKPVEEFPRYQTWGYPVIPALAIVGMVLLFIATLIESLVPSLIGVLVLVVGYVLIPLFIKE